MDQQSRGYFDCIVHRHAVIVRKGSALHTEGTWTFAHLMCVFTNAPSTTHISGLAGVGANHCGSERRKAAAQLGQHGAVLPADGPRGAAAGRCWARRDPLPGAGLQRGAGERGHLRPGTQDRIAQLVSPGDMSRFAASRQRTIFISMSEPSDFI